MTMRTSDRGIAALVKHEGIVPGPYLDSVGVKTYGIGHTRNAGAPDPAELPTGMPADLDAELARVVEGYAHRPQVQERLTSEIADAIERIDRAATRLAQESAASSQSTPKLEGIKG